MALVEAGGQGSGASVEVHVRRPSELEPRHLDAWRCLQQQHATLDRPFLSPEYVTILDQVRPGVGVAVLERDGMIVGFFPFQRTSANVARSPGLRLCDFQGLIAPPDLEADAEAILAGCGLRAWHFDHLIEEQAAFQAWHVARVMSPYVDLRRGYDAYVEGRRAAGTNWVSQLPRKTRKLGREVGELRFEYASRDPAVLQQVLAWKSAQRHRTVTEDLLLRPLVRTALDKMAATDAPGFGCVVSALYAGPHLLAGHVGLRSYRTLHAWFPAFDLAFEKYSPGLLMFTELFRAAAAAGIHRVDLGKGDNRYKQSLASSVAWVAEGCVDRRLLGRWFTRALYEGRARYRDTALAGLVRVPKRRLRQLVRRLVPAD